MLSSKLHKKLNSYDDSKKYIKEYIKNKFGKEFGTFKTLNKMRLKEIPTVKKLKA